MDRLVLTGLAVTLYAAPALAEPAGAEPPQALTHDVRIGNPKTLRTFTLNGQQLSVVAYGRGARADTQRGRDHLDEARAMGKVMPGYPQPPIMTVDVKISF